MKKYPEGSRGLLFLPMWYGNHCITWSVNNGQAQFRNPQNDSVNLRKDCFRHIIKKGTAGAEIVGLWSLRMDNLAFRYDTIGEIVYGAKDSLNKTFYDQYNKDYRKKLNK